MGPKKRPPDRPPRGSPRLQNTIRLSADGLAKVLGDLEARVLRAMWDLGDPAPARAVHEYVVQEHPVSLLTVITVLNRLVGKGILARDKQGDLLHFRARMTEAEFTAHASRRVVEGVLAFDPDAVAASFVDALAERDPEMLADLARRIRRRLAETDRGRRE